MRLPDAIGRYVTYTYDGGKIPMIRSAEGSAPKPYMELRSTATMDCITSAASKTRKEM